LIPNKRRGDAGGLGHPGKNVSLCHGPVLLMEVSAVAILAGSLEKKPPVMVKETREDSGIPQAVIFVETFDFQGQESRKNSGFSVPPAPSCTLDHSRMLLRAAHVRPAPWPRLCLHRQDVCAADRQKAAGYGESDE